MQIGIVALCCSHPKSDIFNGSRFGVCIIGNGRRKDSTVQGIMPVGEKLFLRGEDVRGKGRLKEESRLYVALIQVKVAVVRDGEWNLQNLDPQPAR